MAKERQAIRDNKVSRPDPQLGFPELWWRGKRPFNGVPFYPAQKKEEHGQATNGWRNQVFWGDNLQVLSHLLRKHRGRVDLIYIDPPFDSKAEYKKKVILKSGTAQSDHTAFEEKQYGDIWTNDEYLQFMYERLMLLRELLADTGSLFLHCDYHRSHHLRCVLDEVFGPGRFRNEIAWCYSGGGTPRDRMPNKHDTIFWYTKGPETTYNVQYRPYSEGTLQRGRTAVKGPDAELRAEGTPINDWWPDVKKITSPTDPEKLYYPTQKSEELLERIINMASKPGDLVVDVFMGSGTTPAVAMKSGRRFIGADINLGAVQITTTRLLRVADELHEKGLPDEAVRYTGFDVSTVNQYDIFRNEPEARALLTEALAIRPLPGSEVWHGELGEGGDTRQVRIMPINRIATRADLDVIIKNLDWKALSRRHREAPNKPVLRASLICMGHESDLSGLLVLELRKGLGDANAKVDIEVVDILRDQDRLEFKRDSHAKVVVRGGMVVIESFYPMNLLQKLSLDKTAVEDWKELVESVFIDFHYDGEVLRPTVTDVAEGLTLVRGVYEVPKGATRIRVKITDLLSDVLELSVEVADTTGKRSTREGKTGRLRSVE
jgi:DNA modification methylase